MGIPAPVRMKNLVGERSSVRPRGQDGRSSTVNVPLPLLADEWLLHLKRLNFSEFTLRLYRSTVRQFIRMFPNLKLQYLSAEHIERFILRGVSPRTAVTQHATLSSFCRYLVKRGHLKNNPCRDVERPRFQINPRPAPSWQEFLAVRRACKTIAEAAIVETLYFTGMRINEFRHVRLRDVDFTARRITVVRGKGGKTRMVTFPERVAKTLREYLERTPRRSPDEFLFIGYYFSRADRRTHRIWKWAESEFPGITTALTGEDHKPGGVRIGIMYIMGLMHRLGKTAGLPYRLTPHVLRHGFIRLMKTKGVPVEMTAKLAGHDISMTVRIYGQLSDDDLQTAYDRAMAQL